MAGSLVSVVLTLFMPTGDSQGRQSGNAAISYSGDELDNSHNESDELIDHNNKGDFNAASVKEQDKKNGVGIPSTLSVIQVVWVFLLTKVVTGVANAMSSAAMPLILKNNYQLNEQSLGFSMSVLSAGNAIVNGFLLGPIVALFGGSLNSVISFCISAMCILSLLQAIFALPTYTDVAYGGGLYEFFGLTFILGMLPH